MNKTLKQLLLQIDFDYQTTESLALQIAQNNNSVNKIKSLWEPMSCSIYYLPWLAWANGVNEWDDSWPEAVKREIVFNAFELHKYKGTRYAIEKVLAPFAITADISEWFEQIPEAKPGTFKLDVYSEQQSISEELAREIKKRLNQVDRKSVHLSGISLNLKSRAKLYFACASNLGEHIKIYPKTIIN